LERPSNDDAEELNYHKKEETDGLIYTKFIKISFILPSFYFGDSNTTSRIGKSEKSGVATDKFCYSVSDRAAQQKSEKSRASADNLNF
jgi:hypothetical protein